MDNFLVVINYVLEADSYSIHAVGDSDSIVQPISVEEFPDHCKSMGENDNHPFAEEFQVMMILKLIECANLSAQ